MKCVVYVCQGNTNLWHNAKLKLSKLTLSFSYHEPNFIRCFLAVFLGAPVIPGNNVKTTSDGRSMVFFACKEVTQEIFLNGCREVIEMDYLLQHFPHLEVTKLLKCFAQEMKAKYC